MNDLEQIIQLLGSPVQRTSMSFNEACQSFGSDHSSFVEWFLETWDMRSMDEYFQMRNILNEQIIKHIQIISSSVESDINTDQIDQEQLNGTSHEIRVET